jgi:hypothetical protein
MKLDHFDHAESLHKFFELDNELLFGFRSLKIHDLKSRKIDDKLFLSLNVNLLNELKVLDLLPYFILTDDLLFLLLEHDSFTLFDPI